MRLPYFSFHSQTRSRNSSRPRSWRLILSVSLSSLSTTICVAMPGVIRARQPERVEAAHPLPADEHVLDGGRSAWPRCSEPVTLGGGMTMEYGGLSEMSSAWK